MTQHVLINNSDGVLSIKWNRPDRLNAFDASMLEDAAQAINDVPNDVRAIVISGEGRAFSAGGDFKSGITIETVDSGHRLVRAIVRSRVPVISGVNGPAVGMACSIAVAADIALARRSAYFLLAFVNIGMMPDGGATELIGASIGRARANSMAMLGNRLSADDAMEAGLIYRSVADEAYDAELAALVQKVKNGPTKAFTAMKGAISATTLTHLDEALDRERAGQVPLFETEDAKEGALAFREKREPVFRGR
ncbi:enoyl-CoA hydratase-related protein [Paraburkholderia aspalathi]|uniref:Enoyl-CoA hydratase/carnithine racemase n=1 Tax=Paraburkholderia aspalathi TaxID=1324617 RepID=A0A1I7ERV0_9BURK|nr:enoyl-CoA hydratase-related protein [Paraburkholderia aspalathi]SFU26658.1 Enoyl-CoA hydratase/carnithine racemase [Paraburkholderia aspalathi]